MPTEQDIAQEFAQLMGSCQGEVVFVTQEGDRLVADSMLSALVGFSNLLKLSHEIELSVECADPADCDKILAFIEKHQLNVRRCQGRS